MNTDTDLIKERKYRDFFIIFEIVIISVVAITNLVILILSFLTNFRQEGRIIFSIEMLISIIEEMVLAFSIGLAIAGRIRHDFFLNKWSLLVLFLGEAFFNIYTLIEDIILSNKFGTDIFIVVVDFAIIFLITKEMTSLYAPNVTKFIFRFALILLIIELVAIGIVSYDYLSVEEVNGSVIYLYLIVLIEYILTLIVPTALMVLYPKAITCNYDLEDQEVREDAIGHSETK